MLIILTDDITDAELKSLTGRLRGDGFLLHETTREGRRAFAALGGNPDRSAPEVATWPGVSEAVLLPRPFKLASREFQADDSALDIGGVTIGGEEIVLMAGPCAVESEEQVMETARRVAMAGTKVLRGGAFKPRTSPYSFQGLGEEGLKLLRKAADRYELLIISELIDAAHVDMMCHYVDILQIGARNMQNFALLRALTSVDKPILVKRGMAATIDELLMSAEYVMSGGNRSVMVCERGIRSFQTYTRNTLDLAAVPVIRELSHLPIIIDPSHAVGVRNKIAPMARAAVAAGADGVLVEVHYAPDSAMCDGPQSLSPDEFATLADQLRDIAAAVGRSVAPARPETG